MQYWTVQIGVADCWVEDGFDFDEARCESLGGDLLPYSCGEEVTVKVVKSPSRSTIRKLQGYDN